MTNMHDNLTAFMHHEIISGMMIATNVKELIHAFGGTCAVAQWLDVGPSTVSNWKADNAIPNGYHLRIYLEAKQRGVSIDPTVLGFKKWPSKRSSARAVA